MQALMRALVSRKIPLTIILIFVIAFANAGLSTPQLRMVHGTRNVAQSTSLTWSPFGPRENLAEFEIFQDSLITTNALLGGQIDIPDYPAQAYCWNQSSSCLIDILQNPDYFVGSPIMCATPGAASQATFSFTPTVSGGTPPYTFYWSFGDDLEVHQIFGNDIVTHTFGSQGPFSVSMAVIDGGSPRQNATYILPVSPSTSSTGLTAGFSYSQSPAGAAAVTFNASPTGGTGTYTSYSWSFGDGSAPVTTALPTPPPTHSYAVTGIFLATLSVTDGGGYQASSREWVSVSNNPPTMTPSFTYTVAPSRYLALEGWDMSSSNPPGSSLVADLCGGWEAGDGFWSMLNMRPIPGYNPCAPPGAPSNCASLAPGGGTPGLIRRGFSNELYHLNPFYPHLQPNEREITSLVFDSLLKTNPSDPNCHPVNNNCQVLNWMTKDWEASATDATKTHIGLRNDLEFHDGKLVTEADVCFSINLIHPLTCTTGPLTLAVLSTDLAVLVTLGSVPIVEQSLWTGNAMCRANPTTCDPMGNGIFVGSGPYECKNFITVAIGGPCTQDAFGNIGTERVTVGGRVGLYRYVDPARRISYMRCC